MKKLNNKKITVATASVLLGVSERQIYKIRKRLNNPTIATERNPR